jgi:PKHD-type hydroxylase
MKGLYKVIKNIITDQEAQKLAEAIKKAPKTPGDNQVPNSHSYYNVSPCNILLGKLNEKISKHSGKILSPCYSYCRVNLKGAELKPHKDRPSCEYSITINLSQTHPWPIYMGKKKIVQNPGDGVLYKGCEIEHSRTVFEGDEYIQVFLHYVDANGPYKEHIYDIQNENPLQEYHFIYSSDEFGKHINYYKYIKVIPETTVNEIRTVLDTRELHDAMIGTGGGDLDRVKRRSKVYWLPKNDEFLEIYKIFFDLMGRCNNSFYNFKLSQISERIQYTVYNENDQGYYDWHLDMGAGKSNRKLSLVCHLSDPSEYEGGELQINNGGIIVPENGKGTVVIFPSYLLHRVTPVTKGTRRTLVLWVEGPPFI